MIPRKQGDNVTREKGYSTQPLPQPIRLTPQKIEEKREKGCFSIMIVNIIKDINVVKINCSILKVQVRKKRMSPISKEDWESGDQSHDSKAIISCHALSGFTAPQTLKVVGFLKKQKVTALIDSGSTHNFINKNLATLLNCFIYPAPEF